jgi:hypothetical protein
MRILGIVALALLCPTVARAGPCESIQYTINAQVDGRELLDCIKELKFSSTMSQTIIDNLSRQNDLLERSICFLANDINR